MYNTFSTNYLSLSLFFQYSMGVVVHLGDFSNNLIEHFIIHLYLFFLKNIPVPWNKNMLFRVQSSNLFLLINIHF